MDRRAFTGWVLKAVGAAAANPKDIIPAVQVLGDQIATTIANPTSLVFKLASSLQLSLDVSSINALYSMDVTQLPNYGASNFAAGRFAKIAAITNPEDRASAVGNESVVILRSMVNAMGGISKAFDADTVAAILNEGTLSPAAAAIKAAIERDLAVLPAKGVISQNSIGYYLREMASRRSKNGPADSISRDEFNELIEHILPPQEFCADNVRGQIRNKLETVANDALNKNGLKVKESPPAEATEVNKTQEEKSEEELAKIRGIMATDYEMQPWLIRARVAKEQQDNGRKV
jgi:hypothetical protein